ncbi:MAG: hypothetical protein QXU67_04710 [Candidatus Bathyarchaeia archaeon]
MEVIIKLDVTISHVIGSMALILLAISVAAYFVITASQLQSDILRQHLKEVGEYVSLNLMEIITLIDFEEYLNNVTMFKFLKLPPDISGYAYVIELISEYESRTSASINLYLLTRRDISASSIVPLNATGSSIKILTVNDGGVVLSTKGGRIESPGRLYSGRENIVVWGWRENSTLTWVGIGVWRGG